MTRTVRTNVDLTPGANTPIPVVYQDNGDGTFTPIVALSATPTIDIGKIEILGDDGATYLGTKADAAQSDQTQTATLMSFVKGIIATLKTLVVLGAGTNVIGKVGIDQTTPGTTNAVVDQHSSYASPNTNKVLTHTTLDSLFSDDFGGNAVDTTNNWDVLDGGLGANVNLGNGVLTQAAIGSGTTGITDSVASSGLTVAMGTTNGAERWYLSKQTFAGKEDILVILSRSQANVNNSIFVGLCEVDPTTLVPLLNPNFANEFTNRGGCEFGLTATSTAYQAEAIGDKSSAKATGAVGVASALTTTQEFLIEIDSRDIIVSSALIDSVAAKVSGASRVSSQCPNDKKLYKLVMRFKNVGVPTATSVVIQRILVADNYETRVQLSSGEGDQIGNKALGVNVINFTPTVTLNAPSLQPVAGSGSATFHKLTSAATTNATSVKASAGSVAGGYLRNRHATNEEYFKLYNKASAPTVGTDTPVITIGVKAGEKIELGAVLGTYGMKFTTGIAYAITGAYADADTTSVGAGDFDVNLFYT